MNAKNANSIRSIGLCACLTLVLTVFFAPAGHSLEKLKAAATIFPIADIAQEIGGDRIEVITILKTGSNPHTFQLSPGQIRELSASKIIFAVGGDFDHWVTEASESLPGTRIETVSAGISFLASADPHYWLSVSGAKVIARNIASALSQLDPANRGHYQTGLSRYLSKLEDLDREVKSILNDLPSRKIVTFHNGWRYFARDYDLEILANVEPPGGHEPKPRHLAGLADLVRSSGIQVLFVEAGVSKGMAKTLSEDLKLKLYTLDPIGGAAGRESFIDLMRYNALAIREALRHE